jgi:hypothetical protein
VLDGGDAADHAMLPIKPAMFAVRATASAAEGQRLSPVGDAEQEYASDSSGLRGKAHRTQGSASRQPTYEVSMGELVLAGWTAKTIQGPASESSDNFLSRYRKPEFSPCDKNRGAR